MTTGQLRILCIVELDVSVSMNKGERNGYDMCRFLSRRTKESKQERTDLE